MTWSKPSGRPPCSTTATSAPSTCCSGSWPGRVPRLSCSVPSVSAWREPARSWTPSGTSDRARRRGPVLPRAKRALERGLRHALGLGDELVEPHHLLFGIAQRGGCRAVASGAGTRVVGRPTLTPRRWWRPPSPRSSAASGLGPRRRRSSSRTPPARNAISVRWGDASPAPCNDGGCGPARRRPQQHGGLRSGCDRRADALIDGLHRRRGDRGVRPRLPRRPGVRGRHPARTPVTATARSAQVGAGHDSGGPNVGDRPWPAHGSPSPAVTRAGRWRAWEIRWPPASPA